MYLEVISPKKFRTTNFVPSKEMNKFLSVMNTIDDGVDSCVPGISRMFSLHINVHHKISRNVHSPVVSWFALISPQAILQRVQHLRIVTIKKVNLHSTSEKSNSGLIFNISFPVSDASILKVTSPLHL